MLFSLLRVQLVPLSRRSHPMALHANASGQNWAKVASCSLHRPQHGTLLPLASSFSTVPTAHSQPSFEFVEFVGVKMPVTLFVSQFPHLILIALASALASPLARTALALARQ